MSSEWVGSGRASTLQVWRGELELDAELPVACCLLLVGMQLEACSLMRVVCCISDRTLNLHKNCLL